MVLQLQQQGFEAVPLCGWHNTSEGGTTQVKVLREADHRLTFEKRVFRQCTFCLSSTKA